MMQQLLASHQKQSQDINTRLDDIYGELNGKFEGLSTHVKSLEIKIAPTAEVIKR